ncbi:hypothetical protein GCM10023169_03280 [Georgenia halophila]|uniref:PIN domain-containing protein n=1 Tax=Georgenia halophila TaxID=620889 RepID=A0ABP8KVF5_9MICO
MFTSCWTVDILAETIASIRKDDPHLSGGAVTVLHDRIVGSMTERIDDYTPTTDDPIADVFDRHVHAAALAGQVHIVMTQDNGFLKLPTATTDKLAYESARQMKSSSWLMTGSLSSFAPSRSRPGSTGGEKTQARTCRQDSNSVDAQRRAAGS